MNQETDKQWGVHKSTSYGDEYIFCWFCGYKISTWGSTPEQIENSKNGKDHKQYHDLELRNRKRRL